MLHRPHLQARPGARRLPLALLLAAAIAALAGCAAPPQAGGRRTEATTQLPLVDQRDSARTGAADADRRRAGAADADADGSGGDAGVTAQWSLPAGPPTALLLLQHGFARRCANLRTTAAEAASRGLLVLCVDADMARGNPALADRLAAALHTGGITAPDGIALPTGVIVGGHSAGAVFAAHVGARLAALAPARLLGALLLDPVAVDGFAADLQAVSNGGRRPVLAISASAGGCNANGNAAAALQALDSDFVGVQLTDRSTHVDAEGADTDWLAAAACGRPQPRNAALLRTLAAQWASDIAAGTRTPAFYPGGEDLEQLRDSGAARWIRPPAAATAGVAPGRR